MNKQEKNLLSKMLISERVNSLLDIKLNCGYYGFLLYPTNDLWLTKKQYIVLKKFLKTIGESEFYFTQFDGGNKQEEDNYGGIFSESNPVYKFNLNSKYSSYCSPFLYSVSVLFSINGTWAIFIDETFDAGYGIFISSESSVDKFITLYEPIKTEYRKWMDDERFEKDVKYYRELIVSSGVLNLK